MKNDKHNDSIESVIKKIDPKVIGITSSPSTTLEIAVDIVEGSQTGRALGRMVFVWQEEEGRYILSLGQIVEVTTKNRWHEDPSFKGVIKRHGSLPHLSGAADNRLAAVSVQSSFAFDGTPVSHVLGVSPSTGQRVHIMSNEVMLHLVNHHGKAVSYIGRVYGSDDINLPMWFKHFGESNAQELGAGDAYHIGVFGKTGSGKTVTAAFMLLAYAKNKENINVLVLDPQGQFTLDNRLLPGENKFECEIKKSGMRVEKCNLIRDVFLPDETEDDLRLFADLLVSNNFVRTAFKITTPDKQSDVAECIFNYMLHRKNDARFSLRDQDGMQLLSQMLRRFWRANDNERDYLEYIYAQKLRRDQLRTDIEALLESLEHKTLACEDAKRKWLDILGLYSATNGGGKSKTAMDEIVEKIVGEQRGNLVILDLRQENSVENENMQALFLSVVERRIADAGARLYAEGKMTNCLVVMDEAHRYVNRKSPDERVRLLSGDIIDAVRTTRKYGIGHMFITQSLESMDEEIIKQMRIFAFGFGLTLGSEIRKIRELIDNPAALNLYKSFIDPGNMKRFPFMFVGPVSPLSATGAPLFAEIYTNYEDYKTHNK